MKTTILNQETLTAMCCKAWAIDEVDLADVPKDLTEDMTEDMRRALQDMMDFLEASSVEEKLALIIKGRQEARTEERNRRMYEMVMNGCDATTRAIMAKNAGFISVENYEDMLREVAEREEDEEAAREMGLTADEYAQEMQTREAAADYEESRRREIIAEGKSYYEDKQDDYERAAFSADKGDTAYYCRLYEIRQGRTLTREEMAEDRERENDDGDFPLQREIFADFARSEARLEQALLGDYAARYGDQTEEFYYQLGCYAIEAAGYISAERGERLRVETMDWRTYGQ